MVLKEVYGDVLKVPKDYTIVHCVSADYALGAGVAKQINSRFNIKNELLNQPINGLEYWNNQNDKGFCVKTRRVINLVTKKYYYQKPTYQTLTNSLLCMRDLIIDNSIKKIAMPKIGCGLDRLKWGFVLKIIQEIFDDLSIEVVVYDFR